MSTGPLMTMDEDVLARQSLLPTAPTSVVSLYPTVHDIADKVTTTQGLYGTADVKPSSRVRDLVDLVIFANTQDFDGGRLQTATAAEWMQRALPGKAHFEPPAQWRPRYKPLAQKAAACADVRLVDRHLSPALSGTAVGLHWSPQTRAWSQLPRSLEPTRRETIAREANRGAVQRLPLAWLRSPWTYVQVCSGPRPAGHCGICLPPNLRAGQNATASRTRVGIVG